MINNFFGYALPKFSSPLTAKELNNNQYWDIFNRLSNVALSRFKWNNLPDTCRPEILEETLYFYGSALFFYDENIGFAHTPATYPGSYNIYYEPVKREAYSFNYTHMYTIDNSVIIKANHSMMPDYLTVLNYTGKIANSLRAIDVHTETLKRPYMVRCPEKSVPSVKAALTKIADNEVAILGEKLGDPGVFEVLSLATTSYLGEMWANVKNYLNQVYSSLGVKNAYSEKDDRMLTGEVEGQGNAIRHTLESELNERQLACERINAMFSLNISVEANELETFTDEIIEVEGAKVTGGRPAVDNALDYE